MTRKINYIFLAAGKSQRFKDVGEFTPKQLISVEGLPLILWAILNFDYEKNDEIFIICQSKDNIKTSLQKYINKLSLNFSFIELEHHTQGPADTVRFALDKVNFQEPIIIVNTDQYIFSPLKNFIKDVRAQKYDGLIPTMKASGNQWSYVKSTSQGIATEVAEKVQISDDATVGIYSYARASDLQFAISNMIKDKNLVKNEYYMAPTYNYLIANSKIISSINIGVYGKEMHSTGTPTELSNFMKDKRTKKEATKIKSKLKMLRLPNKH